MIVNISLTNVKGKFIYENCQHLHLKEKALGINYAMMARVK
jgi:hypothetical protein